MKVPESSTLLIIVHNLPPGVYEHPIVSLFRESGKPISIIDFDAESESMLITNCLSAIDESHQIVLISDLKQGESLPKGMSALANKLIGQAERVHAFTLCEHPDITKLFRPLGTHFHAEASKEEIKAHVAICLTS